MGLNRTKPVTFHSYPDSTYTYLTSWINTSRYTVKTLDYNNQFFPPWHYRAHPGEYDYTVFLWQVPVCITWREEIPNRILYRRHIGEYLLHTSGATPFHSYWCLGSRFCLGRSTGGNEAKTESLCIPHTSPAPPLGSSHWRFFDTLLFPKRSVAGSSWGFSIWYTHRLFLQKKGAEFLLV